MKAVVYQAGVNEGSCLQSYKAEPLFRKLYVAAATKKTGFCDNDTDIDGGDVFIITNSSPETGKKP